MDNESIHPCAPARVYVLNGKPIGARQSVPVVPIPETMPDRLSYGALIRAESEYRPSAAARARAAASGGRATKGRR